MDPLKYKYYKDDCFSVRQLTGCLKLTLILKFSLQGTWASLTTLFQALDKL